MKTAIAYTLFAIISTLINLLFQWLVFVVFDGVFVVYVALFIGTIAGLISKYVLDKRWIFYYQTVTQKENFYKFVLYSLMGVFTTIIFWGTEMVFYFFLRFEGSQYVGGAIGLSIGYLIKYQLDKKFVFRKSYESN